MTAGIALPQVALHYDPNAWSYATEAPYHPQLRYPEYDGPLSRQGAPNAAYDAVRETLHLLRFDDRHYGEINWNPLGDIISPGQIVVIKPNLVMNRHLRRGSLNCLITHGSVIRAVVDYVCLALRGSGQIIIGDAPLQMADFAEIAERNGLYEIADDVRNRYGMKVEIADFRRVRAIVQRGQLTSVEQLPGDPNGYAVVDLGRSSLLADLALESERFRVTCYDVEAVSQHHNEHKNEYLVAGSILQADCVISISKLKTHRKAGLTAALKNLVGINGHKDWLPHHRCGAAEDHGDEYLHASLSKQASRRLAERALHSGPELRRALGKLSIAAGAAAKRVSRDAFTEGSWYGNDTLWRTVLDLNRILIYADRDGILRADPQRRCLHLVDAIIAGEGEGPLEPNPKVCGMTLGSLSAAAVDTVAAGMMGFDFQKVPTVCRAYEIREFPLVNFAPQDIRVHSNQPEFDDLNPLEPEPAFHFLPPRGWRGHIERDEVDAFISQS